MPSFGSVASRRVSRNAALPNVDSISTVFIIREDFMRVSRRFVATVACALLVLSASWSALAQTSTKGMPITAEQAFDAVQMHKDPATGQIKANTRFVLVDIRTLAEVYWVGTAAQATNIVLTTGKEVHPDFGKVKLEHDGMFIVYDVKGRNQRTLVQNVASMTTAQIGVNIPYKWWDEKASSKTLAMVLNPDFDAQVALQAGTTNPGDPKPVLILFCRSGDRSDVVLSADTASLFDAIYEIDQAPDVSGYGGFEGSIYGGAYNGYRGFPGRDAWNQLHPTVSWKDAGLPIYIGAFTALPALQ
jgi:rhodanese-related sulfurtransferase